MVVVVDVDVGAADWEAGGCVEVWVVVVWDGEEWLPFVWTAVSPLTSAMVDGFEDRDRNWSVWERDGWTRSSLLDGVVVSSEESRLSKQE